jgi:hypothetical protein
MDQSELIANLRERIARLEERLLGTEKALELAQKEKDNKIGNIGIVVSLIIAISSVIMHLVKKG